jgi:signal transduction histidine kinase
MLWGLILGAWTLLGFLFASQFYLAASRSGKPIEWYYALGLELSYAYLWAALTPLVLFLARRYRIERVRARYVAFHLLASLLIGLLMRAFHDIAFWVIAYPDKPLRLDKLLQSIFFLFDYGILTYWVILLIDSSLDFYHRYRENELKASRLETQLAQAELQALKMQLHPHFLFNTLNSISALLYKDTDAADRMIARLGGFLRLTLDNSRAHEVTLARELDFLRCYLDIEQIRFQDRLTVNMDIAPDVAHVMVPNLVLQPLVENAIKHGISAVSGPGRIDIQARSEAGYLVLRIRDNGPGLSAESPSGIGKRGIGLVSTEERLAQLYNGDYHFDLENGENGGVTVTLEIPIPPRPQNDFPKTVSSRSR